MPKPTLPERVEILEEQVGALEELPARVTAVEWQLVQLRTAMGDEFSAVRSETAQLGTTLREEIAQLGTTLRNEMEQLGTTLRNEMEQLGTTLRAAMGEHETMLRDEIRAGDEETRRYMRVLHEDLVGRIALLQEARGRNRKRR